MNCLEEVCIIMPAYNCEHYIGQSIESVINQSKKDWKLIICDDGSKDSTFSIALEYAKKDNRILVVKNHYKKGAPGARNTCLDYANGQYIAFLDSDDLWDFNKLELQIAFMKEKSITFCYSYHNVIDESEKFIYSLKAPRRMSIRKLLLSNFIPCLTVIYDTKEIKKTYQPNIKKRNDYALWLKIFAENPNIKARCYPYFTASYRSNSYGLSSDNVINLLSYYIECLQKYANCSTFTVFFSTSIYIVLTFLKKKMRSFYNSIVVFF
jgi:teichuronic acid biosynthesis glycosyltransferase TuaG